MAHLIDKDAVVAEIERIQNEFSDRNGNFDDLENQGAYKALDRLESSLDTLEVKDPYEQCVQYDSIKAGIQAHAETYSFNIESQLFLQLTKEQQKLWRKEIEQACISGGEMGVELAKDARYKENLEVKEVDIEKEVINWWNAHYSSKSYTFEGYTGHYIENSTLIEIAKHFYELGMVASNKTQKGEDV